MKEEQVNILVEDVEKCLEDYKTATELTDKQLADTKGTLKGAKVSYDNLLKQLKQTVKRIHIRYQRKTSKISKTATGTIKFTRYAVFQKTSKNI